MKKLALVFMLALVAVPGAFAHRGGSTLYRSTVTAVDPPVSGVHVEVLGGDDRIYLTNETAKAIVIDGYSGEPYLRFTRTGTYENVRSPAVWLNLDRYARKKVPRTADPKAAPRWRRVASGGRYAWHDHRAHWMSPIFPPKVRAAPDERHRIFDWRIPGKVAGRPLSIRGTLEYVPKSKGRAWAGIAVAAAAGLAAIVGVALVLTRNARRGSRESQAAG